MTVPARSRHTIGVNAEQPEAGAFSMVVESTNGVGIIAERAMYWNDFEGGHDAVGVTEPAKTWRFPEGFTGSGFKTYLLIAQSQRSAERSQGRGAVRRWGVADDAAGVDGPEQPRDDRGGRVCAAARSRVLDLRREHSQPIVAERAIYFDEMREGNSTAGITADSTKVGFADGQEGVFDGIGYETFYLLANATDTAAEIKATFYLENGTGIVRTFTVNPRSRYTLSGKAYGELNNQRFAAFFESTNGVGFSAERAVYWGENRYGGHGSTGVAWTEQCRGAAGRGSASAAPTSSATASAATAATTAASATAASDVPHAGSAGRTAAAGAGHVMGGG